MKSKNNVAYQHSYYVRHRKRRLAESKAYNAAHREEKKLYDARRRRTEPTASKLREYDARRHPARYMKNWANAAVLRAKKRAKRDGREFNLEVSDIVLPDRCPALGIPLVIHAGKGGGGRDDSPALDRTDNTKGYVKGNIAVISAKANRIKTNATAAELRAVADWMETQVSGIIPAKEHA